MPKTLFKYDVFLSHASQDKSAIRYLANRLKADGLKVWFDEWTIKPGDSIPLKIEEGLQNSRVLVLCMTKSAFDSEWVSIERHTILFRDPSNKDRRFIPMLFEDCEMPLLMKQYAYLDWKTERENVYKQLLSSLITESSSENIEPNDDYLITTLQGHTDFVEPIAISLDGKKIASGSGDKSIKIWDIETYKNITTLKGHSDVISDVIFNNSGKGIISCSRDHTIKIWDIKSGKCLKTLDAKVQQAHWFALTPDEKKLISGSKSFGGTIYIWDIKSGKCLRKFEDQPGGINCLAITPDGKNLISGSQDKTIKVWEIESGKCLKILIGHVSSILGIVITKDGESIISSSYDKTIKIWELESGKNVATLEGHTDSVWGLGITPDRKMLVSGSRDKTIKIWELETGKNIATLKASEFSVYGIAVTPDSKKIISSTERGNSIKIWSLQKILSNSISDGTLYTNAKIALIGESGVGKTGLAIRLVEDDWRTTESTHGMNIWPLELPNSNAEISRDIWLWDFAGQPDYRLIHQLYMEETSLAVLVIDPQKEDPLAPLSHWEKALTKAVKIEPKKLLVAGRCDRGGTTVSNEKLETYCKSKQYISYYFTEAKTGKGCEELKEAISNNIPWNDLPWTSSSKIFSQIKNGILQIKEENVVLSRFDSLKQRLQLSLKDFPVKIEEIRAVLGLLEGQGVIKILDFGDLVLLQPQQINNYASAIIREVRKNAEEVGYIRKDDVLHANLDFHDLDRIESTIEKEILRAIVQILIDRNICLHEDTSEGTQLVFPSYFKVERPELLQAPNVFVTYSFAGILEEIYATLIVRLIKTNDFSKDKFWKYAADFKTHSGKRLGLQMVNNKDEAEIKVYFEAEIPDDTKVSFIKYIHQHLVKHARDVKRIRSYVCPECNEPVAKSRVMKRLESGKEDIICDECDHKFPFQDIIEQKFGSLEFAQKVNEMDNQAEFNIDNESRELILVGHSYTTIATAGHIFRVTSNSDWGIDGEIEFKDKKGNASGKKVYVQLKSGGSYLKTRQRDEEEIFQIKNDRLIDYWQSHNYPVMLVIRDAGNNIRWMNITSYLEKQARKSKSIVFKGDDFTPLSVDNLRKQIYPDI